MKQIVLQDGLTDVAPRTTEDSIYPNIDATFSVTQYDGPRLNVRRGNVFGAKVLSNIKNQRQGLAVYGNTLVRMANVQVTTPHYIYTLSPAGVLTQVATFNASTGHSNSIQFAPTLEAGQDFPYLYVANLEKKCSVLSITAAYAVTIVQTITIGIAEVDADCNLQIGDDGYMWCVYLDSNDHYHFIKFRRVSVSEGNVTLSQSDVVDEWTSVGEYPYATYVWQGMIIRNGQLWLSYGQTGAMARGIVIFDTTSHALVTTLDLSQYDVEWEDLDFWNDSVLIGTYGNQLYQLKF